MNQKDPSSSQTPPPTPPPAPVIRWSDRLLAEAVLALEESRGTPLSEPDAETAARDRDGNFETRLAARARYLSVRLPLTDALARIWRRLNLIWGAGLLLAFLLGAGATRLLFVPFESAPVNVAWLLGGLLGPPTLMLALWLIVLMFSRGRRAGGLLGNAVILPARWLGRRLAGDEWTPAALEATLRMGLDGAIGRWSVSALSHGLWSAFLAGGLAMALLVLSLWQFDFAWETTLLAEEQVAALLGGLADPLARAGFDVPDEARILASRMGMEGVGAMRAAWAEMIIASLLVYGLAPRLLLLVACLGLAALARRGFRLDTDRLGYQRLYERLMLSARRDGIVDPDGGVIVDRPVGPELEPAPIAPGAGPIALCGLEMAPPEGGWPPPVGGITWQDLGFVDSRQDRQRLLDALAGLEPPPRALLVTVSLLSTPDRGMSAFLARLTDAAPCPLLLVLSDGAAFARRGDPERRLEFWRMTAAAAGVTLDHVLEADLATADGDGPRRLARFLGAAEAGT